MSDFGKAPLLYLIEVQSRRGNLWPSRSQLCLVGSKCLLLWPRVTRPPQHIRVKYSPFITYSEIMTFPLDQTLSVLGGLVSHQLATSKCTSFFPNTKDDSSSNVLHCFYADILCNSQFTFIFFTSLVWRSHSLSSCEHCVKLNTTSPVFKAAFYTPLLQTMEGRGFSR